MGKKRSSSSFSSFLVMTVVGIIAFSIGMPAFILLKPLQIDDEPIVIDLRKNPSLTFALAQLEKKDAIFGTTVLRAFGFFTARSLGRPVQRGIYRFTGQMAQWQAISMLFQRFSVNVTFPEGMTLPEYAAICADKIGCDSAQFMRWAQNDSLLKAHNISAKSCEGYLMPDTYKFFKFTSELEIIDRLLREQEFLWKKNYTDILQVTTAPVSTKHEILTLASIVEAETPVHEEKPRVAGVYSNRLRRGMKLQADPTVQFALGGRKRRVLLRDLEVDNLYNTYKYAGLPPGPINSPGRHAIEAALRPEKHRFFYFVAKADGTNQHTFSENEHQHSIAVAEYRKRR